MVHFENADTTLTAVVCTHGLPCFFADALLTVFQFHVLALERWCHAFRNDARVSKGCTDVGNVSSEAEAIENHAVEYAFER